MCIDYYKLTFLRLYVPRYENGILRKGTVIMYIKKKRHVVNHINTR